MNQLPIILLLSLLSVLVVASVLLTKVVVWRRRRQELTSRFDSLLGVPSKKTESLIVAKDPSGPPELAQLSVLLQRAGVSLAPWDFLLVSALAFLAPVIACLAFGWPEYLSAVLAIVCGLLPYFVLNGVAERKRNQFQEQLPNAIDLLISVLKSGHSVPQAVKAVAEETAHPCGGEFADVACRMNLGQNFADSLSLSVSRWDSFELGLVCRAAALQAESGGSMSGLLEKTNATLRQRIKLRNQIRVLTAQSRLSAWIAGLLPLVLAIVFQASNPNYLKPLLTTHIGQVLLACAFVAEVAGIFIMRKLSSLRV